MQPTEERLTAKIRVRNCLWQVDTLYSLARLLSYVFDFYPISRCTGVPATRGIGMWTHFCSERLIGCSRRA